MNRDKVKKILGVCGATVLLTAIFTYGFVHTVEKGLHALGGDGEGNYVSSSDKFIGIFVTSGGEDNNETQQLISKKGKVYGKIELQNENMGEGQRFIFSSSSTSLKGEVFNVDIDVEKCSTGKYGAFHYIDYDMDEEIGYDEETGKSPVLHHYIKNVKMHVNKNAIGEKFVMYVNPIFENKNGEQYVTDNKCEKIEYTKSDVSDETTSCTLETKLYDEHEKYFNNRINIEVIYDIPQIDVDNSSLFF